jgi:hypothetical protein
LDAVENRTAFSDCGSQERHSLADDVHLIEEANYPSDLMLIFEYEHGK